MEIKENEKSRMLIKKEDEQENKIPEIVGGLISFNKLLSYRIFWAANHIPSQRYLNLVVNAKKMVREEQFSIENYNSFIEQWSTFTDLGSYIY